MFNHILIPVDNDPGSRRAINRGVWLARCLGARVTGFHTMLEFTRTGVVDELLEPPAAELNVLARARAESLLEPLRRAATSAGVPYDALAERGDHPGEAIVAVAERRHCDLIVMASHGRRGLARIVLGSQTQYVLDHTATSVLVVR